MLWFVFFISLLLNCFIRFYTQVKIFFNHFYSKNKRSYNIWNLINRIWFKFSNHNVVITWNYLYTIAIDSFNLAHVHCLFILHINNIGVNRSFINFTAVVNIEQPNRIKKLIFNSIKHLYYKLVTLFALQRCHSFSQHMVRFSPGFDHLIHFNKLHSNDTVSRNPFRYGLRTRIIIGAGHTSFRFIFFHRMRIYGSTTASTIVKVEHTQTTLTHILCSHFFVQTHIMCASHIWEVVRST